MISNNYKTEQIIYLISAWLKNYWSCILILLTIIGFVSKALYNYPMGLMAVIGLYRVASSPKDTWNDKIQKTFIIVFLCLWLPLLMSFPDAVNQSRAAQTVFPYLRFVFSGLFIIQELSKDNHRLKFIVYSVFIIVTFWCVDASIQFFIGQNLLGYPYKAGDITGMFYPRNTISHICSILSAFCFIYIYINLENKKWLLVSLIPLFFIILLSGRRAAWIMLALSSFGFLIYGYIYYINRTKFIKITCVLAALVIVLISFTIILHAPTNNRFKVTLGLFSNDYDTINRATAVRLPIWETAYTIFKSNPVNGIGPRGFRYAYKDYASPDDWFVSVNVIPTQPHILILEILAETGLIGFLGYLIALYFIIQIVKRSRNKESMFPFFIPVIIALFPFNAHMAFYGSIWSSMIWWLMAVYFSSIKLYSKE